MRASDGMGFEPLLTENFRGNLLGEFATHPVLEPSRCVA
jgi:hypothetical protein